jgi:uncharacterized protein (DUF2336 family)
MQTDHYRQLREIASGAKLPDTDDLVEVLGQACLAPNAKLEESETALLGDILRQLIRDVEMPVRRALADQLSDRDDAPHELILLLANDVIDVAYPLLAKSPMLRDQDLIAVVSRHARQHAIAVTKREKISAPVGDASVETGDPDVVVSLLQNDGANISEETMDGLVSDSESNNAYQGPLLSRKDLNLDMAMRMADWVGESLRGYIAERFNIADPNFDKAVSNAVLEAINSDIFDADADKVILDIKGEEPGPRLLHTLTHDNLILFKQIFEELCDVPSGWAEDSLYCSSEALAIASKALRLDCEAFARILCHLHSSEIFSKF